MTATTQGHRWPDSNDDVLPPGYDGSETLRGGYWKVVTRDGPVWYCAVPMKHGGVASLTNHTVVEHDDGTITVSPSILVPTGQGRQWHGYLERGVWRPLDDCVVEAQS